MWTLTGKLFFPQAEKFRIKNKHLFKILWWHVRKHWKKHLQLIGNEYMYIVNNIWCMEEMKENEQSWSKWIKQLAKREFDKCKTSVQTVEIFLKVGNKQQLLCQTFGKGLSIMVNHELYLKLDNMSYVAKWQ